MTTAAESFRAAMVTAGLDYGGPIIADGKLHRFRCEGDRERNSWFLLHGDAPIAGAFGCWRRGIRETWCQRNGRGPTDAEWQIIRRRWREAEAAREADEAGRREKARRTAEWILNRARPADPAHRYLAAKAVKAHGELREWRGALMLPLRDVAGELHSLQFIRPDGTKRFLTGGRIAGCAFVVNDRADGPLVLCEGYATAATIHESTRLATVAALNAGNLRAVAEALHRKHPGREIIIAGDNDHGTPGNPGLAKATEAAKVVGARLAVPRFRDATTDKTDFNDLAQAEGAGTVARQIEAAAVPPETDAETFARLAKLPPAEYDRTREAESKRLKIRAGTLDGEVAKLRPQAPDNTTQGTAVDLADVELWPDPVNGSEVLSAVAATFSRYLSLPPGAADAIALWIAHAHAFEAFIHTPRLNPTSPEKQCGKTLLLDIAAPMLPRALRTESITPAVLFRLVEMHRPTLLLDEVDCYLPEAEELRGLLNAGHKRGGRAYRCEGESNTVRGFSVFTPAALSGIGSLPGTLHDRSIVIRLTRAKAGEVSARFDSRRTAAETELCRKLARWTADHFQALESCDPALPPDAFNRIGDNWRPLFAIAQVAGDDWPARAADAFAKLTTTDDREAQGIGATLLADIRDTFNTLQTDRLASAALAEHLAQIEGRPWHEFGKAGKPITANQVAKLLRRFDVSPRAIRIGTDTPRGYLLTDFTEAFDRFLQKPGFSKCNTATRPVNIEDSSLFEVQQAKNVLHPEKLTKPNTDAACCTVALRNPTTPEEDPESPLLV